MNRTQAEPTETAVRRSAFYPILVGVVLLTAGLYTFLYPERVQHLIAAVAGSPSQVMAETQTAPPSGDAQAFDHSRFNDVVSQYVDADGWVDYQALLADTESLDAYIASLADAPFGSLSRDDKLALLINAYNACTLRLILDHYPVKSIMDIPDEARWDAVRWDIAGTTVSLNQIEHEMIRAKFKEPRIHFALVCAAYSCPKLRNEAYTAERLEAQLADQTAYTHSHDRWLKFDKASNTLSLTKLYDWYGKDFEAVADSVLEYVATQSPLVKAAVDAGDAPPINWLDYDWKLNDAANAP